MLLPESNSETETAFTGEHCVQITQQKTEHNKYEISCGACGKIFYADKETAHYFNRRIEQDLDNSFLCGDCQNDFEENIIEDR